MTSHRHFASLEIPVNKIGITSMKIGTVSRVGKSSLAVAIAAAFLISSGATFGQAHQSVAPAQVGYNLDSNAPVSGGGNQIVPLAANTANTYSGTTTGSVLTTTNWSLGHVPTVSEDAVFDGVSAGTGIRTFNNGSLTVGSWNVTASTGTFSLRNGTAATTSTLTLGGAGDNGNGVTGTASTDLLFAAGGSTFNITGTNGTAILNVVLAQSGTFDAVGTIGANAVISGVGFGITKTGAGTLTLSGANTFSGGLTLSTGTLNMNNAAAPGTGTFTINGGTITNTSGAAITLSNNNAQTWGGDFSFDGSSGSNNLNLGTGAVTLTGNRIILNMTGATSTLTVGGAIGDGGNGFSLSRLGTGTGVLILTGNSTYSGGTTIGGGTFSVSSIGNAGASGNLGTGGINLGNTTTGGTLLYTGGGETTNKVFNLSGTTGGGIIDTTGATGGLVLSANITATGAGTKTLTLRGDSTGNAINGSIVDNGGANLTRLAKSGTGTWTLGATNTYSGGTTISGGVLIGNHDGAFGTGNITLTAGAITLTLQGGVTQNYIADTANLTIVAGNTINLNFSGTDTIGSLIVDGNAVAPGLYGAGVGGTNSDGDFIGAGLLLVTTQAVPERSTWSMLVMGAALLLGVQRWRRRRTS